MTPSPPEVLDMIAQLREVLETTSRDEEPARWAELVTALGALHLKHLQMNPQSRAEDLEEAIAAIDAALTVYTWDRFPDERFTTLYILGTVYLDRVYGDRMANVEQATRIFEELLAVTPRDVAPLDWAGLAKSLALCHRERVWDEEGLETAITILEDCLPIYRPETHPWEWADSMRELGICWRIRLPGDRAENLEKAIECYQQASRVFTRDTWPVDWARLSSSLGIVHLDRVRGDRGENLARAIHFFQEASEVLTRDAAPLVWAELMDSLGLAHTLRLSWDGPESLEVALAYHEKALEVLTPANAPYKWAEATNNLAMAYTQRVRGGRAENLEKAFALFEQVTTVRTREVDPLVWAQLQHNLGNVRLDRLLGDRAQNLEETIQFFRHALEVFSFEATPVQWATTTNNLAQTYLERLLGDRADNVEVAIHGFEQALRVHTRGALPLQWAQTSNNLALAYRQRIHGDRGENLDRATALFESLFAVFTREAMPVEWASTMHNLGGTHRLRFERDGEASREQGERCYRSALEVFQPETHPLQCTRSAGQLGLLLSEGEAWEAAVDSFRIAVRAGEILYRSSVLRRGRQAELDGLVGLHRGAAYAAARAGRSDEAVLILESGRARGLGEVLERDAADLERIHTEDPLAASLYREAVEHLRRLEAGELAASTAVAPEPPGEQLRKAHASLDKALDRIRRIPGYESFLRDPDLDDIASVVAPEAALVYLLTDPTGSLALVLHRAHGRLSIESLRLDELRAKELERLLFRAGSGFLAGQTDPEILQGALAEALSLLGKNLIDPLSTHLRHLGIREVVLIPTGLLALLPLHAAGEVCFLDEFEISFALSARVLAVAQSTVDAIGSPGPSLAGVGNPLPHPRPLANARLELEEIASLFREDHRQVLYEEDATEEELVPILSPASHLHLSCHGVFDPNDPLASHLQLAGGDRLELREILARQPFRGTRLVVLSACQTALADFLHLPDEVIGLPAGFLQAGAAGVVGTLWPVDDLSTALLMVRFYELHLEEGNPPARALGRAQRWLRDATTEEIFDWCERRSRGGARGDLIAAVALRLGLEDSESRPFAPPVYWAPFVFVGA